MGAPRIDVRVSASARAPLPAAALARLAAAVLRAEGTRRAVVSVALVGRRRIRTLNRTHLGRDADTDVIAFGLRPGVGGRGSGIRGATPPTPGPRPPTPVVGDIYICVPVAREHAARLGLAAAVEVRRLVIHGVLHVLGYDHPDGDGRTRSPMWRRQERYLTRFARRTP